MKIRTKTETSLNNYWPGQDPQRWHDILHPRTQRDRIRHEPPDDCGWFYSVLLERRRVLFRMWLLGLADWSGEIARQTFPEKDGACSPQISGLREIYRDEIFDHPCSWIRGSWSEVKRFSQWLNLSLIFLSQRWCQCGDKIAVTSHDSKP